MKIRELRTLSASGKVARARIAPRHPDRRIPSRLDVEEPALRSRIRRESDRWTGLDEVSRLAQVVVLEYGGRANSVIKRGQTHLRSRMFCRKPGTQQVVEGRGHRDLTMWNDVNPQVLDFNAHPFLITAQDRGNRFDYSPDHIRLMRDGKIELIEVKRSPADLRDPLYRAKLGAIAEIVRRGGWHFRILYHHDITGPRWRMPNVEALYSRRFLLLSRLEQDVVTAFVLRGVPSTWADLRDSIAPDDPRRGNAVIENAIALGRIDADLDARFTAATVLTPLAPMPHNDQIRI